jgi:RNA polymerase sigma-70 factor (ECF subfamily)
MDRHADGDPAAFGEVYDLLAPRLHAFFLRQTGDRSRAEDLVQQTLMQMHAARRNYARGSEVFPWAFAIGRNVLIDAGRRTRREVLFRSTEENADAADAQVDRASAPDELAEVEQSVLRVRQAIERLPENQRAAYDLVRSDGVSIAETAEVLGTTPGAVKLSVHRVYKALRAVLAD